MGRRVEDHVADLQLYRPFGSAAADQRPEPCHHLGVRERFDQVVVGAGVEPTDPVGDGVARRQHQDGHPAATCTQRAAHRDPVEAGQHHVEQDRVVVLAAGQLDRLRAVAGHVNAVPVAFQATADGADQLHFVVNDQDAHPTSLPLDRESQVRVR